MEVIPGQTAVRYFMGGWNPPFGIEYLVDSLNGPLLFLIALSSLLILTHFKGLIRKEIGEGKRHEFFTLFLLQITGLFGLAVTGDLFNLYVLLEVASLSAYALCAEGERNAPFFAFRYMIFGTVGACMYLLGVGYIYALTGSLNMLDLKGILPALYGSRALFAGACLIFSGLAIKMALFPLHIWLPDAYTSAPRITSTLLASLSTKVYCYVFIRISLSLLGPPFFSRYPSVFLVLGYLASVASVFSGVMAFLQKDIFRMSSYLVLCEVGYILMGISVMNRFGLLGSLFQLVNGIIMMGALFCLSSTFLFRLQGRHVEDLRAAHRVLGFPLCAFFVLSLCIVGVPPLPGFFSKWFLLLGAAQNRDWALLFALLISSGVNAATLFRIVEYAFFSEGRPLSREGVSKGEYVSLSFFLLLLILLGIGSEYVVHKALMPFVDRTLGG